MPIYSVTINPSGCLSCCSGDCICPTGCSECCDIYELYIKPGIFEGDCACFDDQKIRFNRVATPTNDPERPCSDVYSTCIWVADGDDTNTEDGLPCGWEYILRFTFITQSS